LKLRHIFEFGIFLLKKPFKLATRIITNQLASTHELTNHCPWMEGLSLRFPQGNLLMQNKSFRNLLLRICP